MGPYGLQVSGMNNRLDDISFLVARFLEAEGYTTLPISASNIWRYNPYKDLEVSFAPDLAHRYAAVAAGLGQIGWNGLCLTPEFGPRNRFVSVVTTAALEPTPMYRGDALCDRCMECVKNCPTDAFRQEADATNEIEIDGEVYRFPLTNKWRCAWAENFSLNLAHKIPEKVDESVIRQYMEKYGPHGGELGSCLRFCMVPERRYYEPAYTRAPRRRKEMAETAPDDLLKHVIAAADRYLIDIVAVQNAQVFAENRFVHPHYHLPDVRTIISLGIRVPERAEEITEMSLGLGRWLTYPAFDITHDLDVAGYSATTKTHIADNLVAQKLGVFRQGYRYLTVLTSAELPTAQHFRQRLTTQLTDQALRDICHDVGVDLVGFFGRARYESFADAISSAKDLPRVITGIEDKASLYNPYVPKLNSRTLRVKSLDDWLPGAKGVIVLGLHYPDASLDIAKVTPAETVGPYGFVSYESLRLLWDMAHKVIARLNDAGYRAVYTEDLTGLASKSRNVRRMLPDMRANQYAAMLGGLAYQGIHGYPITDEFGVRQRFLAIVTDYPVPDDPLHVGESVCADCDRPCIAACPTRAIEDRALELAMRDGRVILHEVDCYACDWAKRYVLSGEEGPKYQGLEVDVPVPEERTVSEVVKAVSSAEYGVQKRLINVAEECLRVCPARGRREPTK
jgi:epoxyqueuosine reductase QueG